LSFRFGAVKILAVSMGVGSAFTVAIPFCARLHHTALFVCLFLIGFCFGAYLSSVSGLWAHWACPSERSRLIGLSNSGPRFGSILALSVGGFLCVYCGWSTIFYSIGTLGIIWSIVFYALASDTPQTHKFISQTEKVYILKETRRSVEIRDYCQQVICFKTSN
jgi:MFS family permease